MEAAALCGGFAWPPLVGSGCHASFLQLPFNCHSALCTTILCSVHCWLLVWFVLEGLYTAPLHPWLQFSIPMDSALAATLCFALLRAKHGMGT